MVDIIGRGGKLYRVEADYLVDLRGNKVSLHKYSQTEAVSLLDSCVGCTDCIDCANCVNCTSCYACTICTNCVGCNEV